jgi:transcriptional regulator with AAA-type ATPase domain
MSHFDLKETVENTSLSRRLDTRTLGVRPRIYVLYSSNEDWVGCKIPLPAGALELGRGALVDGYKVADPKMSRRHLALTSDAKGQVWTASDLGSSNGTFVNARPLKSGTLKHGDILRAGSTLFLFHDREVTTQDEEQIARIARSDISVLIEGETGAGKEVMARRIHDASRRAGEFVAVNCGALPKHLLEAELFGHSRGAFSGAEKSRKGLFQSAEGGTIVLDEIGEMDIEVQPTLLRVLQNRAVRAVGSDREVAIDCRVVAATNRDLESEVEAGRFRADLYARLAQVRVNVRPLRERHWEILSLFSQFAELSSASQLQSTVA